MEDDINFLGGWHEGMLRKLLEKWPKSYEAYDTLGDRLLYDPTNPRPEEAVEAFQKAVTINPEYGPSYNKLGDALMEVGHADEAKVAYEEANVRGFKDDRRSHSGREAHKELPAQSKAFAIFKECRRSGTKEACE